MLPLTPGSQIGKWSPLTTEIGPEGVEPTPYRLKGGYAAVTPRPRSESDAGVSSAASGSCSLLHVVRGGIAPATGDVSDRHASLTPPDQMLFRKDVWNPWTLWSFP